MPWCCNADLALYAAKGALVAASHVSTNLRCTAKPAERQLRRERSSPGDRARRALSVHLSADRFSRTAAEEVSGFELLVRWQQPDTGPDFLPAKFIPLAEEAGLIGKIGEWVPRHCAPRRPRAGRSTSASAANLMLVPVHGSERRSDHYRPHLRENGCAGGETRTRDHGGRILVLDGDLTDETFGGAQGSRRPLSRSARMILGRGYSSLGYLKKPRRSTRSRLTRVSFAGRHRPPICNSAIIRAIVTLADAAWNGHLRGGRRDPR